MRRILLTVIASAMLAGCWGGDPVIPPGVDGHSRLYKPTLPTEEVMAAGIIPYNYQALINTHFDRVLPHQQPHFVVFQQRPYGGMVCGNVDFVNAAGEEPTRTPFIVVFNNSAGLEAMQLFTLDDIDNVIYLHDSQQGSWWSRQFFAFQADPKIVDWHTEISYDALTKCGFIVHDSAEITAAAK